MNEIKQRLKTFDEVLLLEILDISSEDIVEAFADKIEDHWEQIKSMLGDYA